MKKKLLSGILGATMMVSLLAGCGGKKADNSGDTKTDVKEGEEVVLNFPCIWVGTDGKAEEFAKIVNDFNTEYDGKYQVDIQEYTDYDAYQDYIRTSISSGSAPDLFSVKTQADVDLYSQSGKVMDLTSFLSSSEMAAKYSEGTIEAAQINGKNFALPWEAAIIPVIWNGSLLEKANITELPQTSADFVKTLDALKASGVKTPCSFMTAGGNAWTAMLWYTFAIGEACGSDAFSGDWDTDKFVKAADWVKTLYSYAPSDAMGAEAKVVNAHFFNNETAVYTNGTWILGNIQQNAAEGVYDNLKFSAGPGNTIIQYTQAFIMSGCVDDAAKQEAVNAFLAWVTDADRLTALSNASGSVFAPKMNAVENEKLNEILTLRDNAKVIVPSFESAVSTDAATDFVPQLESMLSGDTTTKEFVETLQSKN